jgi:uncharacterized Rossmann fold enzyme
MMNSKSLTIAAIVAASALMATAIVPQQVFAGGDGGSETEFNIKQKQKQSVSGVLNFGIQAQCAKNVDIGSIGTLLC